MSTMAMYNPHDIHTYPFKVEEPGQHSHPENYGHTMLEKLESIHTVLQAINSKLAPVEAELENLGWIQLLFKAGQGGNWLLNKHGRFYCYVAAPVATALNVTDALGSGFVLTIPAITFPNYWNLLELPEMSSIILDSTATANQMNIQVLMTNRKM